MKFITIIKLIVSFSLCFSAALIGSLFTTRDTLSTWYTNLNKPFFTPPAWLFGPVWTALYILMAVSFFIVWQKGLNVRPVKIALAFFIIQLILNALWTPLFFGAKMPLLAFIEILVLLIFIFLTILTFYKVSKPAAVILIPYFLWVSFASILTSSIWLLNR